MDSNDLAIALLVAKMALQSRSTFDIALDKLTQSLTKRFRKKRDFNFVAPPLRKSRYFDAAGTIKKVRGVCMYKASHKSVQSLEQFRESLERGEWVATDRVCICLVRNVIESVIRLFQKQTSITIQIKRSVENLMQIVDLVFSRSESKGPQTISALHYLLSQLAFGFRFKEGIDHPIFGIFKAFTGVTETMHGLSCVHRLLSSVVLTSEVIKFMVDAIHLYCTKYAREYIADARRTTLACLTIYHDSEIIEYFCSLQF